MMFVCADKFTFTGALTFFDFIAGDLSGALQLARKV
jgi:hypothetical protein